MSHTTRICLFSQRELLREFFRCANYEFEDVICAVDDVQLLAPRPAGGDNPARRWRNRLHYRLPGVGFDPGIAPVRLEQRCELFLTTCEFIDDMRTFDRVEDWRRHSRLSACYVTELWARAIPRYRRLLKALARFDHVFTNCAGTVESLTTAIGRPVHYLLPGIDTQRFCPPPNGPERVIDVYGMGRRDPHMHAALLHLREREGLFYLHDTYDSHARPLWSVTDHRQHRAQSADLIQRSRYFIVNPAKLDQGYETAGQQEIGYRFFEGAAGGAVMIGRPVDSDLFRDAFHWPDAVVGVPEDPAAIGDLLEELNGQPARLQRIRQANVRNMLLHHDWAHRWAQMLQLMDIDAHPRLTRRLCELRAQAGQIEQQASERLSAVTPHSPTAVRQQ